MKPSIEQIQAPIADELHHFEKKFRSFLKTDVLLLDKITNYVVKSKGKQMRPMFVFLTAGLCGTISEATHRGASLVELLHTATLVHDDVVDDANYRRGFFSVNALWKNKIAVLVGDYFLARGLLLSIDNDDFELLRLVSQAVREMSEGELLQMEKARRLDIDESVYFEIIRQKTATLIAACCGVGAASAGATPEIVAKMQDFGEKIGIAFQIKDDLFDYGTADIGKPIGIDIKERKMTLPLIYSLTQATTKERKHILYLLKNKNEESTTVKEIVQFVRQKGGLDYAKGKMQAFRIQAEALLEELPASPYKEALLALVAYAIAREK
ncbi:polyprenyl synthetase family protein [Hugenholtzia roseola]|uniref:polyprenyl synthetase family protein n=1 Tax=Hugenholtzia roseola TaxID=1002 RepID=UPI00040C33DE|nr:polyprenyl synthetase family protein [Hugenholtzia roseola]